MLFYCLLSNDLDEHINITLIAHDLADAVYIVREQYADYSIVDIRKA